MRVGGSWGLGGTFLAALMIQSGISGAAFAQPALQVSDQDQLPPRLQTLSRQLVAVQTMTLVRTSGRADPGLMARLDGLDAQLRAARQALDVANAGTASAKADAETRIEAARIRYQREAETVFTQLQLATTERDRYARDLASVLIAATPSELEAQRRFGDGDFSVFDPMEAAILARQAAEQANLRRQQGVQLRQLATNYATMVAQSTPGRTSGELLIRWDRAAAADPSDFWTYIQRAQLARTLGDLPRARAAANGAAPVATDDQQRGMAFLELGKIALLQGDLTAARGAFTQSLTIARAMAESNTTSMRAKRDVSLSLDGIGDVALEAGQLGVAQAAYGEALTIARALASADPSAHQPMRDLAIALDNIGDVAMEAGQLSAARTAYSESLSIRRALSSRDSNSAASKRGLSVSLSKVGDAAMQSGDLASAAAVYTESLAIARALALADPTSASAKRGVLITLERLGDVAIEAGDFGKAQIAFAESLAIARGLVAADPSSADAKRGLAASLDRLGDAAMSASDLGAARRAFSESLTLRRALAATDPASAQVQRGVSVVLNKLGDANIEAGDMNAARASYTESLSIARNLATANSKSAEAKRGVWVSLIKIGDLGIRTRDLPGARDAYTQSRTIAHALASADPSSAKAKHDVATSLWRLAGLADGGVTWAQVANFYRAMRDDGSLGTTNEGFLREAEARARNQPIHK